MKENRNGIYTYYAGFGILKSFILTSSPEKEWKKSPVFTELYVAEAARRKGIATSLIFYLEENLKKRGVKSVKVLTGRRNNAAIKTYEQCNFHQDFELLLKKKL